MAENKDIQKKGGFLSRLLRDEAGNTIAILAAAVIPVIGLAGGAVDMSRVYLVRTNLQAACDAGSLMGRKVMGAGQWSDDNHNARTQAERMFDLNFKPGSYGSENMTKSFTETGGAVDGTASADIPMTLMKVFDVDKRSVTVNCQAELRIPNTDVMFVLDVTGSMGDPAPGSSESKMNGLKKATKCFYETLTKINITDISPADCGETTDPNGGNSADVSLRYGFVPYSVNVNVGKLLPLDYMADNWTYQSREAQWSGGSGYAPNYGTESSPSPSGSPTTTNGGATGWQTLYSNVTVGGTTYSSSFRGWPWQCNRVSPPPNGTDTSTGSLNFVSQTPDPPSHPDTHVTRTYEQVTTTGNVEYRYRYFSWRRCRLQRRYSSSTESTQLFTTTVPITWVSDQSFEGWHYKPVTFDVSALKNTSANAWRTTIDLPIGSNGTNRTITWDGCIEERQTARVNDSDPSDNWDPIPSTAHDMNIDMVPNTGDSATQWGPMLDDVTYEREWPNGSFTTRTLYGTGESNLYDVENYTPGYHYNSGDVDDGAYSCPMESKTYQNWGPTAFMDYINGLSPTNNTYHDIGLLWGARLMSPTGIFSGITAQPGKTVERHMIFMTDGDTVNNTSDYSAYGLNWWDRRQNDGVSAPSSAWLRANNDARAQAICTAVKNMNITLWVVSYGGGVSSTTETRLQNCASPNKYIQATSVADLVREFKAIASELSNLRLTS